MQVKARAVIKKDEKILLCKLAEKKWGFWCLPGGTLEEGESLKECLIREIFEELAVEARLGEVVYVQDFVRERNNETVVDVWYEVLNPEDFENIDLWKASHGDELDDVKFVDLNEFKEDYTPKNLIELI